MDVAYGFIVGRWLARGLPGQEIAACLILLTIPNLLEMLASPALGYSMEWRTLLPDLTDLRLLIGTIYVRRRRLAA